MGGLEYGMIPATQLLRTMIVAQNIDDVGEFFAHVTFC